MIHSCKPDETKRGLINQACEFRANAPDNAVANKLYGRRTGRVYNAPDVSIAQPSGLQGVF